MAAACVTLSLDFYAVNVLLYDQFLCLSVGKAGSLRQMATVDPQTRCRPSALSAAPASLQKFELGVPVLLVVCSARLKGSGGEETLSTSASESGDLSRLSRLRITSSHLYTREVVAVLEVLQNGGSAPGSCPKAIARRPGFATDTHGENHQQCLESVGCAKTSRCSGSVGPSMQP